jgi:peroxiredoxin
VEFPYIQDIYEELRSDGFTVLAIEISGDRNRAETFMEEEGITFMNVIDAGGRIGRELYGVYAYPTTFLIDREGIIRYRHIGFSPGTEKMLKLEIQQFL